MKIVTFSVYKQISPDVPRPFIVMETTITTDGPRTRICDGRYATEEVANEMLKAKEDYVKSILKVNS